MSDENLTHIIRKLLSQTSTTSDSSIANAAYDGGDFDHIDMAEMIERVRVVRTAGTIPQVIPQSRRKAPLQGKQSHGARKHDDLVPHLTDEQRRLHRAHYRFVPLNETIVHHTPTDLDLPLPGNLCATIKVRWVFDTPMLIGEKQATGDTVGPIKIGERWAIPGATLRGMIRSIVETATFGRLGRFERDAEFTFKTAPHFRKTPHKYSVGDVAERSNRDHVLAPIEGDALRTDFAEALFGHVVEPDAAAWSGDPEGARKTFARRGRVDFGLAWADESAFQKSTSMKTIMGAPRPSFSPFYLVSEGAGQRSWSDSTAKLAGRKRYLPRYADTADHTAALKAELHKPIQQFRATSSGGRDPGPEVTTDLVFLNPARPGASAFDSEIRLHNVSPIEAGAVIWALTWGGDPSKRHMIGRAKGFGAGQAKAEIVEIRGKTNAGGKLEPEVAAEWMKAFKGHMGKFKDGELSWDQSEAIQALLASADPKVGRALAEKLDTLPLRDFANVRMHRGGRRLLGWLTEDSAKRKP